MKKIIYTWTKFCCEDPSKIEGYDRWFNDLTDTVYHCHHRLEIELGKSCQELKDENLYYNRPASELIIMTESEHHTLHNRNMSDETRRKLSKANSRTKKGKILSEETKRKISEATKGSNNGMYGKQHTDETRRKLSELKYWNNGVISKRSKTCPGSDFAPGRLRHK